MKIPHSRPYIDKKDIKSVVIALKSRCLSQGKKVKELENFLKDFYGVRGAVCVSSGTAALHLSLLSLGVSAGDSVLLPSFMCSAPLNAVKYLNAEPVFFDIAKEISPSPEDAAKRKKENTKAIILPHLFGLAANIDEFLKLKIPIIEDCAHSIGCHYKGRLTGTFGRVSILSFYATKVIAGGEGGAILSNDVDLIEKIKDLRDYDEKENYKIRFNYKMTDIQASLILSQFKKLKRFISRRKEIAKRYSEILLEKGLKPPMSLPFREHIYFRYIVLTDKKEELLRYLNERGIVARQPVYKPLHLYFENEKLEVTEEIYKKAVSIPLYPSLTCKEVSYIAKVLREFTY